MANGERRKKHGLKRRETKRVKKKGGEESGEAKLDDLLARRVSLWGQALGHTCS
jgi:hypothetical protein